MPALKALIILIDTFEKERKRAFEAKRVMLNRQIEVDEDITNYAK